MSDSRVHYGNYSPYSITINHPYYTNAMSEWAKRLRDTHFIYSLAKMVIHFAREEDLTAFKLTFNL